MRGQLEAYFDAAFTAPNGVKRLRELILTLAVQGKLTEQCEGDEPASELLKKIAVEKKKLEKEGKIKKQKPLPPVGDGEKPYVLPKGWEWVRLGEISLFINGDRSKNYPAKDTLGTSGIPFISAINLQNSTISDNNLLCVNNEQYNKLTSGKLLKGDIVFCIRGSLGKSAIYPYDIGAIASSLVILREFVRFEYSSLFLQLFLQAPFTTKEIKKYDNGTAQPNLSAENLKKFLLPLPPLAEQQRIVERVNALMAQCDALEAMHKEQELKRTSARAAAMYALAMPQGSIDPAFAFSRNWGFLARHFEQLFTTKQDVAELRKTILQLAVMGKLTEQHASDEPASELLKKIATEKKKLEKEGKIKKQKPLPSVGDDEKPYALPNGWEWVRLGEVALSHDSGWSPQCLSRQRVGEEWGVLKVSAVSWGEFNPDENKALPSGEIPRPECAVYEGDLLISRANTDDLVARSVVVTTHSKNIMMSDKIVRIKLSPHIHNIFINIANLSSHSRAYYIRNASGTSSSMKNVSRDAILHLPVPLPPLAEQQRIVERVNALMTLCDTLEQNMDARAQTQTRLLDTVAAIA